MQILDDCYRQRNSKMSYIKWECIEKFVNFSIHWEGFGVFSGSEILDIYSSSQSAFCVSDVRWQLNINTGVWMADANCEAVVLVWQTVGYVLQTRYNCKPFHFVLRIAKLGFSIKQYTSSVYDHLRINLYVL